MKQKRKVWTRKGRCEVCGVSTNSFHKIGCLYEYKLPIDSKMYQHKTKKKDKLKEIIRIIKY